MAGEVKLYYLQGVYQEAEPNTETLTRFQGLFKWNPESLELTGVWEDPYGRASIIGTFAQKGAYFTRQYLDEDPAPQYGINHDLRWMDDRLVGEYSDIRTDEHKNGPIEATAQLIDEDAGDTTLEILEPKSFNSTFEPLFMGTTRWPF